ncbi:MAG: flavodoxin family protein [Oscillospiraceae bacterium]|nr:flavodoxin family protein [Oscillospiraceae bacterium]
MKVLIIHGGDKKDGCTGVALDEMIKVFSDEGVETELIFIGNKPIPDCMNCHYCREHGKCAYNDIVNEITEKAKESDGFVFACPVYYAHPTGRLLSVLDRAFYSASKNFSFKPGCAVLSARRNGQVASMDVLNKYFSINNMPIVSANYWNHVFGAEAKEVYEDEEGVATMRNLARNMAWLMKCIELGKQNGMDHPENERAYTNFTRR